MRCNRILIATALSAATFSTAFTTPALANHRHIQCKRGYQVTSYGPPRVKAVWRGGAQNHGNHTALLTVIVDRSGTVSTKLSSSVEAEVGGGFGFFSASIKAQLGVEITHELTTHTGVQFQVTVPAHRRVIVSYGPVVRRIHGVLIGQSLEPNQLYNQQRSGSPLPRSCGRRFLGYFHSTVTLPYANFSAGKAHRI